MCIVASRAFGLAATVTVLALSLPGQKGTPETRAGFEFKPPRGWIELPATGDRDATLRLFAAPRALADKGEGSHTPLLRVMFFAKGGDASQDTRDGLPRTTPFRSLEDFARRGLGMKEVNREAEKAGTFEGTHVTAKGEDERMLIGHAIPLDNGEAAICFEVLSNHAAKLKKEFDLTFASLAAVERTAVAHAEPPWADATAWNAKDAAARAAEHRKWAEQVTAETTKAPEAGFKVQKSKYWTVLSAADAAFTKKAIAAAETARAWCAQKMPDLCKDAPLPAVLRIFDNLDHYRGFLTTRTDQREYDAERRELYFVDDPDNGGNGGYGMLFRAVLWHMFDDVDPGVLPAMPRWFDNGCWEFLRSTRCDGKKIEFASGDVERGRIEYQQRANTMPALWNLIQESIQPSPTDGSTEKDWGYTPECSRLMRWLWINDGLKAFEKPNLVSDYVRGLGVAFAAVGPDPTIDVAVVGISEADRKVMNTRHYEWRDALLKKVNDAVVGLQVDAWKPLNEKWLDYNKKFK
ncbi:MAG TPA: hypothetical protein VFZ65_01720 [Planctomycetota bacterium]|nr:hypothetical protein [Planctomycetota bacterium]